MGYRRVSGWILAACWIVLLTAPLRAIVVVGAGDPDRNTEAPAGALAESGWQWTGRFGAFCGVPVGRSSFLTAGHIGGIVGDRFEYRGRSYRTVGYENDTASDLRIWHVSGEFDGFAPLASAELQVGEGVMLLGRGGRRGTAIEVQRRGATVVAGWRWGTLDGRLRWGTNTVWRLADGATVGLWGPLVGCRFDGGTGDDEGCLTLGDSGGPLWVRGTAGWELAAIHYAVESAFSLTGVGTGENGAITDFRGLYRSASGGAWELTPANSPMPVPATFYSTRVHPRRAWVESAVDRAPSPARMESASELTGDYGEVPEAVHDPVAREFRVAVGQGQAFFRVTGTEGIRVVDVGLEGAWIRVRYD